MLQLLGGDALCKQKRFNSLGAVPRKLQIVGWLADTVGVPVYLQNLSATGLQKIRVGS